MFGRNKEIKKLKERIEIQNKIINNLQRIIDNFGILKDVKLKINKQESMFYRKEGAPLKLELMIDRLRILCKN